MKLDMSRAWNDAVALMRGNRDVLLVVAGVFFFLPYLAAMLLMPQAMQGMDTMMADVEDPTLAFDAMINIYARLWWVFVLMAILQGIGMLGLLALLTDRSRPTVGEALGMGAKSLPSYIAAQILQGALMMLVAGVPIMLAAATGSAALIAVAAILAFVFVVYVLIKFSLIAPVIMIDRMLNPVKALARSWQLTKGNSVRLCLFYVLLFVALLVLSTVFGLIVGLATAMLGAEAAMIASGVVNALVNMVLIAAMLAVLAAIHRQLAGPSAGAVSETFD